MQYHNIPAELRSRHQWVTAGEDRAPRNPRTGGLASPTDPKTWGSFDDAVRAGSRHIGYVLSREDPYAIIDLDNKVEKPLTEEQWERHKKILDSFASYTEKSTSGRGYHIIVRGKIPAGTHSRDGVEVYSSERYMICTGDVVRAAPITDYQELLTTMYGEMAAPKVDLVESEESILDRDLVDMAMHAVNGDKFNDLCAGKWQEMGYPSQSEADLALLSILAFYTQSNQQVRRLFRMSGLGAREKALKNDRYIDYALEKIRAKQPSPVDFETARTLAEGLTATVTQPDPQPPPPSAPTEATKPSHIKTLTLPPGLTGEIAQYFYYTSIRPVPEVSLAAAIAVMSGVAGRSYNISETGLNQYIILVAKTGSGKEAAVTGIDKLVAAVRPSIPMIDEFIGPSAFASGQALIKVLNNRPCFVSVLGEFGLTLQQICDQNASSAEVMLRKVLLDLYAKSGWQKMLRPSVYSDEEKNTNLVQAPNVTLLGETTPETFFDGLDSSHISEGLIPRFSVIQYTGNRPPRNPTAGSPPPAELTKKFADLVTIALTTQNNNTCVPVATKTDAQLVMDNFDRRCDREINFSNNETETQIWNRAHLKVLKLSALIAVGVNMHQPEITKEIADWAVDFVIEDVEAMSKRFRSGDIGRGDSKLSADLRHVIEFYLKSHYDSIKSYGVEQKMHSDRVLPYSYLMRKTASVASFRKDRRGSTGALKSAINDLMETGMIAEVPTMQMVQRYSTKSRGWVVGKWK